MPFRARHDALIAECRRPLPRSAGVRCRGLGDGVKRHYGLSPTPPRSAAHSARLGTGRRSNHSLLHWRRTGRAHGVVTTRHPFDPPAGRKREHCMPGFVKCGEDDLGRHDSAVSPSSRRLNSKRRNSGLSASAASAIVLQRDRHLGGLGGDAPAHQPAKKIAIKYRRCFGGRIMGERPADQQTDLAEIQPAHAGAGLASCHRSPRGR